MKTKRSHEGYLLNDNRASGGGVSELPTITCCHCQRIVVLNPLRTRERGYCRKCDHYVCDDPACNLDCRPFKAMIDDLQDEVVKLNPQGG